MPPCDRFEIIATTIGPKEDQVHSVGFVADLTNGLPEEFRNCDVFYAELPWEQGFQIFNDRAGIVAPRTYHEFMSAIGGIVQYIFAPVFLIVGRRGAKMLPTPHLSFPIRQHNEKSHWKGQCVGYNTRINRFQDRPTSTDELITRLAEQFGSVGHLACGYGNAAVAFHNAGKRFVACDFNPNCIGVLKWRLTNEGDRAASDHLR